MPALILSRLTGKNKGSYDPLQEFKISPILNRVFGWILELEHLLMKVGLSLPFGGSLLLVARK